ncbi:hypothetical protein PAXRUDRAFT_692837 [Paxillus rubicundulus Ve08.2h10]|uniref:Uncharacterized protein n=1 Tax=Paxillus rubicundulus Ve08.2h10 TaxID=930991 RepID=A0A0D0E8C6_9AGAM|nr:hypothetical protein PAXRUDRAFT_692837 [Paxillus rubicundulus Ve08.2h10]
MLMMFTCGQCTCVRTKRLFAINNLVILDEAVYLVTDALMDIAMHIQPLQTGPVKTNIISQLARMCINKHLTSAQRRRLIKRTAMETSCQTDVH